MYQLGEVLHNTETGKKMQLVYRSASKEEKWRGQMLIDKTTKWYYGNNLDELWETTGEILPVEIPNYPEGMVLTHIGECCDNTNVCIGDEIIMVGYKFKNKKPYKISVTKQEGKANISMCTFCCRPTNLQIPLL